MAFLTTDKAIHRPGELAFLRAVVLQRVTLQAAVGSYRFRIVDPKGASVSDWWGTLEDGVCSHGWAIPADAMGGEYRFELRDGADEHSFESIKLRVRRFDPPRLKKSLYLDRESYAAGESGVCELSVETVEGEIAAGATVRAAIVVGGEQVWTGSGTLDGMGATTFRFELPANTEPGPASLSARVRHGGVVETAVETFVVPGGALRVDFYPEGGDLLAGHDNRVYAEVFDVRDRPVSAQGVVVDDQGREVAKFVTEHQGRARFRFAAQRDRRYSLKLEGPDTSEHALPEARENGVVLTTEQDGVLGGEPVCCVLEVSSGGPWVVGVFSRGVLVGEDTLEGVGRHDLRLDVGEAAGVLRVTVFDAGVNPVAERLIHRASDRRVKVTVESLVEEEVLPGTPQRIRVRTSDESGAPVAATVGLVVRDRAVQEQAGEAPLGLFDHTFLGSDLEELDDVSEFLGDGVEARRNIDLLLGTRGWRRFVWADPTKVVSLHGEKGWRFLAREARTEAPMVMSAGSSREDRARVAAAAAHSDHVRLRTLAFFGIAALAGALLLSWRRWRGSLSWRPTSGVLTGSAFAFLLVHVGFEEEPRLMPPSAEFTSSEGGVQHGAPRSSRASASGTTVFNVSRPGKTSPSWEESTLENKPG